MKIPFDISYKAGIEKGDVIVKTKGGDDVKIVLWPDSKTEQNRIVAKVGDNGLVWYDTTGKDTSLNSNNNLVLIVPGPQLTDFERGMIAYVKDIIECRNDDEVEDITRKHSAKLIDIASTTLLKNVPIWRTTKIDVKSNSLDFLVRFIDKRGNIVVVPTNRVLAGEEFLEINTVYSFLKNI